MSTKPGPHPIRCGTSYRYHRWDPVPGAALDLRRCRHCPAVGRVNNQGVVITTSTQVTHGIDKARSS